MAASRAELAAQVAAQRAMVQTTIGQIKIAAHQARIEAVKMDVEARTSYVDRINEVATHIERLRQS
jgi:hypothetical protein